MSVHVQSESVNATVILHEEAKRLLTPGQIAIITISTTFAFYLTVMFVVCMGEYYQYTKGKKRKGEVRRKRHSGNTPSAGSDVRSGSQLESSVSQSDYTSSFQARQSVRFEPKPSTSKKHGSVRSHSVDPTVNKLPERSDSKDEIVTIPFEESLSNINVDCDNVCESSSQDTVMLPLISRQCDDILDTDGDIFCDSVDSRDMYRLEADV